MSWWRRRKRAPRDPAPDVALSGLFADAAAGVLFVDQNRRIVSANDAALSMIQDRNPTGPFGATCGESLGCPLGTACPLDHTGPPETSRACEAPVFGRALEGPEGAQDVLVSCHRVPAGPHTKIRGMVVIRRRAA